MPPNSKLGSNKSFSVLTVTKRTGWEKLAAESIERQDAEIQWMIDILGYEGRYAITDDGRVWSYRSRRWLKAFETKDGYLRFSLCKNYSMKGHLAHRLVASAYIENPYQLSTVNHIDNNPANNKVSNLEWCTQRENIAHSVNQGRHANGERIHTAKLTPQQVIEIKSRKKTARTLAVEYGVSKSQIWSIWRGQSWSHI